RPYAPTAMPVTEGLFDGHALRILRCCLHDGRRGGEEHPGLAIALRRGTRRLRLAALLVCALLGLGLGALGALAACGRVLLVLGRRPDGGALTPPAREERRAGAPAAFRCCGPLPAPKPPCRQVLRDRRVYTRHRHPITQPQPHAEARAPLAELRKED